MFQRRPYLPFILPAFILMGVLIAVPIVVMVTYAMTDYEIGYPNFEFVGAENFLRLFRSASFWHSVTLTLRYALIVTTLSLLVGFLMAQLVDRHIRWRPVAIAALVVPIAMTPSIAGRSGVLSSTLNTVY